MITSLHILLLSSLLFTMGLAGIVINRRNLIVILMCLELMLLATNINLVGGSMLNGNSMGQVFSFFILTIAAAELAIGLAIVTLFFRNKGTVEPTAADSMKG